MPTSDSSNGRDGERMRFNELRRGETALFLPLDRLGIICGEGVDTIDGDDGVEANTDRRRIEGGHLSGDIERGWTEATA